MHSTTCMRTYRPCDMSTSGAQIPPSLMSLPPLEALDMTPKTIGPSDIVTPAPSDSSGAAAQGRTRAVQGRQRRPPAAGVYMC
jgi:hypothetical protein